MKQYLDLLRHVRENGTYKEDRTGTGTYAVFGYQMRYDLSQGFPMLTTKKLHLRSIIHELLWFLSGDTNIRYLKENGVSIWDGWATPEGELGPVYGEQWRSWKTPDGGVIAQISEVLEEIKRNPDSRRLVVSAWNPAVLPDPSISPDANAAAGKQALPPCRCRPVQRQPRWRQRPTLRRMKQIVAFGTRPHTREKAVPEFPMIYLC